MFQDYCAKTFNDPSPITYSDSTISTQTSVWGVTASAIQIRFQKSDSTVVAIPTASFKLPGPKKELDVKEKVGIGIGTGVGAILLAIGGFYGWRYWKRKAVNVKNLSLERSSRGEVQDSLVDEAPPAYSSTKQ